MSEDLHAVRAVVAALVGGVAGAAVLGAAVGYSAELVLEPEAGAGLAALVYAVFGLVAGAVLGATGAVALAFRGEGRSERRTTVLTVLAGGVLWGCVWAAAPGLLVSGVVVLPVAAVLGRWLATRR